MFTSCVSILFDPAYCFPYLNTAALDPLFPQRYTSSNLDAIARKYEENPRRFVLPSMFVFTGCACVPLTT